MLEGIFKFWKNPDRNVIDLDKAWLVVNFSIYLIYLMILNKIYKQFILSVDKYGNVSKRTGLIMTIVNCIVN